MIFLLNLLKQFIVEMVMVSQIHPKLILIQAKLQIEKVKKELFKTAPQKVSKIKKELY
jgi:hypothetical protein